MQSFIASVGQFLIIAALATSAFPSSAQVPALNEKTLVQLQQNWAEARKKADLPFLENFYAKEFTVGNMNGTESSRAQDLEMFSSGDMKPAVITDAQMKVSIYGEAAMVTGIEHLEGTYKGHAGRFDLRFANFFVFRDGRWQIIRHQATPIIDDKSGS
jgi:ketosteroid isomerase-like protein